jgi:hypothetical protein
MPLGVAAVANGKPDATVRAPDAAVIAYPVMLDPFWFAT